MMEKFEVRKVEQIVPATNYEMIERYKVAVHHDGSLALASFTEQQLKNVNESYLLWEANGKNGIHWQTFYYLVARYVSEFSGRKFLKQNATEQIDTATQMIAGSWDADKVGYILTSKEVA